MRSFVFLGRGEGPPQRPPFLALALPLVLAACEIESIETLKNGSRAPDGDSGFVWDTDAAPSAPGVAFLDPRPDERFDATQSVRVEILAGDDGPLDALALTWIGAVAEDAPVPAAPGADGKASFAIDPLPLGDYTLGVIVTDAAGSTASAEVAFSVVVLDADGDGFVNEALRGDDCDDGNAAVNPDAVEVCDEADNDCDGRTDEGTTDPYYADLDGDGFGDAAQRTDACAPSPGWVADPTDCDDAAADVYPGNAEVCDERDNDCDAEVDEGVLLPFYRDADGDTWGDPTDVSYACVAPAGYVAADTDCDDTDAGTSPSMSEVCADGVDNDCDGTSNACSLSGTVDLGIADAKLEGVASDDYVGNSVSRVGDFDGDGLADLLVGAPGADDGGAGSGAAYVFLGPVLGTRSVGLADALLAGADAGDGAGYSVAPAGDFDGDGFDDVLVGAWAADDGGVDAGAAYLVRGPAAGVRDLGAADVILVGENAGDQAGLAVASAGDVDGDGQSDLLVGAWTASSGGSYSGAAYLVQGPRSGTVDLGAADAELVGESAGDFAGQAVTSLGDLDGDGYGDVLVGAPGTSSGTGTAYVVRGPLAGPVDLSAAAARVEGVVEDDAVGFSVAGGGGDVDGDGSPDLMVGATGFDYGGADTGGAFLFFGPLAGSLDVTSADGLFIGDRAGDNAGWSVSIVEDMDGDGQDDMLVGSAREDSGGSAAGAAYLVYGPGASFLDLGTADARILGEATNDYAGTSVAGVGDTDGDGKGDILVGAPYQDYGLSSLAGTAYLVLGTGL